MAEFPTTSAPDFSHGENGLLPAIAQDAETGEVLMLAFMNAASYAETLATGRAVYYSRSRKRLWRKGEESGHAQEVRAVLIDCDADTILLKVRQIGGAACHEGYRSCFFREIVPEGIRVIGERVFDPAAVYGEGVRGQGSGARETGARETGARETGARETGARETGARETGARETGAGNPDERPTGL
jgi:phosphoribosyl-AMP cyclohydrolase